MSKQEKIGLDHVQVTRWQAHELMVHHLQLAAMYFEGVPEEKEAREELIKLLGDDERAVSPALAWYDCIFNYYEKLKKDD